MGEKAMNFGSLANLENLKNVLAETMEMLKGLRDALQENKEDASNRAERNSELRGRLETMKVNLLKPVVQASVDNETQLSFKILCTTWINVCKR